MGIDVDNPAWAALKLDEEGAVVWEWLVSWPHLSHAEVRCLRLPPAYG